MKNPEFYDYLRFVGEEAPECYGELGLAAPADKLCLRPNLREETPFRISFGLGRLWSGEFPERPEPEIAPCWEVPASLPGRH